MNQDIKIKIHKKLETEFGLQCRIRNKFLISNISNNNCAHIKTIFTLNIIITIIIKRGKHQNIWLSLNIIFNEDSSINLKEKN